MMYKIENPYRPIKAEVIEVITETPSIKTIRIEPKEPITFKTGQFVELTVPGVGEAPFTPSSRPAIKKFNGTNYYECRQGYRKGS